MDGERAHHAHDARLQVGLDLHELGASDGRGVPVSILPAGIIAHAGGEHLQQVEHARGREMDVLEDEDGRLRACDAFDEAPRGVEERLAVAHPALVPDADQHSHVRSDFGGIPVE